MKNLPKVMLCITVLAGIVLVINGCDGRHPENPTGWAVGDSADGYGAILCTTDAGENWVRQGSAQDIPAVSLRDVSAIDAHNVWVVGPNCDGYGVILRTEDGGDTWVRQGSAEDVPTNHLIDISAPDSSTAWAAGGDYSFLLTTDGGISWTNHQPVMGLYDANGVCAVDLDTIWFVTDNDGIYYTTDGGVTWTEQIAPVNTRLRRICFVDARK